jgi:protein SCO1/2
VIAISKTFPAAALVALLLALWLPGCATKPQPPTTKPVAKPTATPIVKPATKPTTKPVAKPAAKPVPKPITAPFLQAFQVRGSIRELKPDGITALIAHEEIPGYMDAMVMPFQVKDAKQLKGLAAGDTVSFQLIVSADDGWIEQVVKLESPRPAVTNAPALPAGLRIVREVAPLAVGDVLPEYQFTNELGAAVSLGQLRGEVLALTFVFTRCPFPTFCPRMALNFGAVQTKLKAATNAPAHWRLLAVSFDPEYDTPAVLKEFAARYDADPARWNFLTGAPMDIAAITEQFGVTYWRENSAALISHNLRTVVVDAEGRVRKILPDNAWTSDELVAEMLRAANPPEATDAK